MCHSTSKISLFTFMLKIHNQETIIGFQRLSCKKPDCKYLLKKINFSETWEHTIVENGVSLIRNNGSSYYVCPRCKSKNFVVFEGEKIILEKIIKFEPQQAYPKANERPGENKSEVCFADTANRLA
jgi:Zn finger protein HypA/HybF involved in hydrogenase expression